MFRLYPFTSMVQRRGAGATALVLALGAQGCMSSVLDQDVVKDRDVTLPFGGHDLEAGRDIRVQAKNPATGARETVVQAKGVTTPTVAPYWTPAVNVFAWHAPKVLPRKFWAAGARGYTAELYPEVKINNWERMVVLRDGWTDCYAKTKTPGEFSEKCRSPSHPAAHVYTKDYCTDLGGSDKPIVRKAYQQLSPQFVPIYTSFEIDVKTGVPAAGTRRFGAVLTPDIGAKLSCSTYTEGGQRGLRCKCEYADCGELHQKRLDHVRDTATLNVRWEIEKADASVPTNCGMHFGSARLRTQDYEVKYYSPPPQGGGGSGGGSSGGDGPDTWLCGLLNNCPSGYYARERKTTSPTHLQCHPSSGSVTCTPLGANRITVCSQSCPPGYSFAESRLYESQCAYGNQNWGSATVCQKQ